MQDLWGDERTLPEPKQKQPLHTKLTTVPLKVTDCQFYGHTWQPIGMAGEKHCQVCHITGYCPGCTPNPPVNAQAFYCTRHTPQEGSA